MIHYGATPVIEGGTTKEGEPVFKDYMVDLESMGTESGDAIIAIGVVPMDIATRQLGDDFYIKISLESCQTAGLNINADTVMWWMQQDQAARDQFKNNNTFPRIADALRQLSQFIDYQAGHYSVDEINVWGNGSIMDNALLKAAYKACNAPLPWTYKGDLCYRTLRYLTPSVTAIEPEIAHHALHDAKAQALTLFKRFDALGL